MTEQQIRDGYERLGGALLPPLDTSERVARRVTVRRRRRRAGVVGAATLVVVAGVGSAVVVSGGDDPVGTGIAVDPPSGPVSTLVMTRPDGSTVAFPDVTVSCDPPVANGDQPIDSPTPDRIWAYSPIEFTGSIEDDDAMVSQPFVMIQGILSELGEERVFTYPIEGPEGASPEPINVFIADTEGAPDGNELSSSVGDTGTVRVLEASCDPVPVLRLEVGGTLGSEEGKQSVELAGSLG
ncbi:hypothetical protein [Nocardioides sp. SR21]|uniref:hypothetical protein n=1 Tax=Nocardioides sp. SR21 TaxID=2919501 RepID=UPI001FAA842E|nr:hypothetical protein [Nocardioides sp. SR21]